MTARVTAKWIGATRNRGCRTRLYDVLVNGQCITDQPCTQRQIASVERWWKRQTTAPVILQRTARGYRGQSLDGHEVVIRRIVVPERDRHRARRVGIVMARVLWEPRFDGLFGDVQTSARAAATYLSACLKEAREAR